MTPNELLLWLSARKQGSWLQFRTAVENLDIGNGEVEAEEDTSLPLHQRVRHNLERLGHVEFDAAECRDGWRVVPPTLALSLHRGNTLGVLCGARSLALLENIERTTNGLALKRILQTDCPDVIRIHALRGQALEDFARHQGILCQCDSPAALLSNLPRMASMSHWKREQMPAAGRDWDVKQFVIGRKVMRWRSVTLQEANGSDAQGLFRFTRFQRPQYFLREGSETIMLPGAVGKYYVLFRRRRSALRYDRKEAQLAVPAILRPPLLTERALILCSGFPPSMNVVYGRPRLTYCDIPEEVAGMAAEVLGQDLL